MTAYPDRRAAGLVLAKALKTYEHAPDTLVLALPRGGVPIAYEIAHYLSLPLDVFIVRKLGVPGHEELAFGALAANDSLVFNETILRYQQLSEKKLAQIIAREKQELQRRQKVYRGSRPFPSVKNKTIILVDDGIATGATIKAALRALAEQKPAKLIIAVPVADPSILSELKQEVDSIVCPLQPEVLQAVGLWYQDFTQTSDQEVITLLEKSQEELKA